MKQGEALKVGCVTSMSVSYGAFDHPVSAVATRSLLWMLGVCIFVAGHASPWLGSADPSPDDTPHAVGLVDTSWEPDPTSESLAYFASLAAWHGNYLCSIILGTATFDVLNI